METPYLDFACHIARKAGAILLDNFTRKHRITYKGEINLITEADHLSEDFLVGAIKGEYPTHAILTEERGNLAQDSDFRWIIDPLDGTTNYAHGYPVFSISIALEIKKEVTLGVIYQPLFEELFTAQKGKGAHLNGRALAVSPTAKLSESLLATGFPYDIRESKENNLNYFVHLAKKAQAIRRAGSAALDLAYVAAGRFDGFWELKLMPWDTAAGILLVQEAGGKVTDMRGDAYTLTSPHIVATNGKIHEEMLKALAEAA